MNHFSPSRIKVHGKVYIERLSRITGKGKVFIKQSIFKQNYYGCYSYYMKRVSPSRIKVKGKVYIKRISRITGKGKVYIKQSSNKMITDVIHESF